MLNRVPNNDGPMKQKGRCERTEEDAGACEGKVTFTRLPAPQHCVINEIFDGRSRIPSGF